MRIKVARTAGFCFGVRKALDLVLDAARSDAAREVATSSRPDDAARDRGGGEEGRLWTLGPLIHNDQALQALEASGVRVAKDLDTIRGGTVVIRAHGAGPSVRDEIRARHLETIDATCPRVVRCQGAVERAASRGRQILIAGDADHAEVAALVDFARTYGEEAVRPPEIVSTLERAGSVELRPPVTLVAQTTFNAKTYGRIAEVLRRRLGEDGEEALEVVESLCRSTEERQRQTEQLAREVDAVVVVGGHHSANTRRLAEVASGTGKPAFHVETADELRPADFEGFSVVGVAAGASTPAWITESVAERLIEMGSPVRRLVRGVATVFLGTNLLLAAGAASVTYAAMSLAGIVPGPHMSFTTLSAALFLAFVYVFFAYAANRARERRRTGLAAILSAHSPAHIRFFDRHTGTILAAAWGGAVSGVAIAFWMNAGCGLAFLGAVLFAALYSVRILSARPSDRKRTGRSLARLRDIPGSKDFFVALAFAFVAAGLPLVYVLAGGAGGRGLVGMAPPWPKAAAAGLSVFVLGFCAATALALGDVHSDRLMGRESVAVLLGYRRSRILVAGGAAFVLLATAASAAVGWTGPAAFGLAAAAAGVFLTMMKGRRPGDSLTQALLIQMSLFAAGPVAWLATFLLAA